MVHGNLENITSLSNIQKETDDFSQKKFKKLIMKQINTNKI